MPEGGQAIHERRQRRILTKRGDLALKGCGRRDLLSKQLGRSLALNIARISHATRHIGRTFRGRRQRKIRRRNGGD